MNKGWPPISVITDAKPGLPPGPYPVNVTFGIKPGTIDGVGEV